MFLNPLYNFLDGNISVHDPYPSTIADSHFACQIVIFFVPYQYYFG